MKLQSDHMPDALAVEPHGESAELIFRENIRPIEQADGTTGYAYDEYRLSVPNREQLRRVVNQARADWLAAAKQSERDALAAEIRAKRDALLAASDAKMCLDRMGLEAPDEPSFSAWLTFLKRLGAAATGAWAKYRAALRDLTRQPGFPYDVVFPTPPQDAEPAGAE